VGTTLKYDGYILELLWHLSTLCHLQPKLSQN